MASLNWDEIHVGYRKYPFGLFIGKGKVQHKGRKVEWETTTEDRTDEILTATMQMMSCQIDLGNRQNNKPYSGYQHPQLGTLLMIKPGYEFEIKPARHKRKGT